MPCILGVHMCEVCDPFWSTKPLSLSLSHTHTHTHTKTSDVKEALSVLMLCAPVFIFTSGSSALLGRPRCALWIWWSLLAIFNILFWVYASCFHEKMNKTRKYSKSAILVSYENGSRRLQGAQSINCESFWRDEVLWAGYNGILLPVRLVLVCVGVAVKRTMYQCKVDVDMLNAVEYVGWRFER